MSFIYMTIIVPSAIAAPIIVAATKLHICNKAQKTLFVYLTISALFNIAASITAERGINNLPGLHLYTVFEFCSVSILYRYLFTGILIKRLLVLMIFFFPLFSILYVIITHSLFTYNIYPRFTSSIIIVCLSLYFLHLDLSRLDHNQSAFNFIVVFGFLMYFSSCSILFLLSNYITYITSNHQLNRIIWNMHATLILINYILFTYAYASLKQQQ